MGVLKAFRGQGIGEQLLTTITSAAIDFGFVRLELEVFSNNQAGVSLYKKQGFVLEGTKEKARYIDNEYQDVLIMSKLFV